MSVQTVARLRTIRVNPTRWLRMHARWLATCSALIGASFSCGGCNALVDTSTAQCNTHADCTKKGDGFAETFCSTEKICRPLSLPCATSRDCSQRFTAPGYCRPDGVCTPVLTDECREVVPEGALSREHVTLVGFMGPVRDRFASNGVPLRQGAELALEEIETLAKGIPGLDTGPQRHLAMLVCHDTPEGLDTLGRPMNVARHLVDTVGVPAIIGPSKNPADAIDVITDVTTPAGVLTLSPSASHPALPDREAAGLFWRTVPSDTAYVPISQQLFLHITAALRADRVIAPEAFPTVVHVARSDSYGALLSQLVLPALDIGTPPGWSYDAVSETAWDAKADAILQARPHVIFAFSTAEFATELLPRIERRLSGAQPRPHYLLFDGARVAPLLTAVNHSPELAKRILIAAPGAGTSAQFDAFRTRFIATFAEEPGSLAEFAYDAVYLLAYAVARTRTLQPTGFELRTAMENMSCADRTKVRADPQQFSAGARAAAQGGCVDFEGASGAVDFSAKREAAADYGLWCAGRRRFRLLEISPAQGIYFSSPGALLHGWPDDAIVPFCPVAE